VTAGFTPARARRTASKPPSRTSRRPPGSTRTLLRTGDCRSATAGTGARARAVCHPIPTTRRRARFVTVNSLGSCVGSYGATRSIPTLPTLILMSSFSKIEQQSSKPERPIHKVAEPSEDPFQGCNTNTSSSKTLRARKHCTYPLHTLVLLT